LIKEELPAQAAAQLLIDAGVLTKLIEMRRNGATLELLHPTKIGYEFAYTILANPKDSDSTFTFYLSAETLRTVQYSETDTTGTTMTQVKDYEVHNAVYLPTISIIAASQAGHSTIRTYSIEVGVGIYEEYFSQTTIKTHR
jgi:hypothetical protein